MSMRKGDGNCLTDSEGRRWLDMLSGILNVSLGHGSDVVLDALGEVQEMGLVNTYDRPSENAERLKVALADYKPGYSWQLLNTGAEAIERAIQVASTHLGRRAVVAVLPESFHGKSITMAGIRYDVPWGNPYDVITLSGMDDDRHFDVLIYEPFRGWDGLYNSEVALFHMCQLRGALLVADEMITGFLRCGERFQSRSADMIISGKGLAQGVPLAVLGVRSGINDKLSIGWNTTCGGNNLSATVGLRVLEHLVSHEQAIKERIHLIANNLDHLYQMEGSLGFLSHDRDPAEVRAVFERRGVIVSWHGQHIRIAPSFYSHSAEIDKLVEVTEEALCL